MSTEAWKLGREFKLHPVPSCHEITNKILSWADRELERAAFVAVLYLTFSRIHEILPAKYKGNYKDKVDLDFKGITLSAFNAPARADGRKILRVSLRVQKFGRVPKAIVSNKDISQEAHDIFLREKRSALRKGNRELSISIKDNSYEEKLHDLIVDFYEKKFPAHPYKTFENEQLFARSYRWGRNSTEMILGLNPHSVRNCRITHLVNRYNLSPRQLQLMGGWADVGSALTYITTDRYDIENKMLAKDAELEEDKRLDNQFEKQ